MGVVVEHVADHERGPGEPRGPAQGAEVGLDHEVAVALFPACRLVARHRLHVDVVGQQIVAGVGFLVGAVDEELGLETLAHEAALHVDERRHHGIDGAGFHLALEVFKCELAVHSEIPISGWWRFATAWLSRTACC